MGGGGERGVTVEVGIVQPVTSAFRLSARLSVNWLSMSCCLVMSDK